MSNVPNNNPSKYESRLRYSEQVWLIPEYKDAWTEEGALKDLVFLVSCTAVIGQPRKVKH